MLMMTTTDDRVQLLLEQERFLDAVAVASRALESAPDSPEALADLAEATAYLPDGCVDAIRLATRAIELDPAGDRPRQALAFAHLRNGDRVRAREAYRTLFDRV
jgi:cytochrome c-type biogenesis protein CcmH/NrfG